MTKVTISRTEEAALYELMKPCLGPRNHEGVVNYQNGFSDESIFQLFISRHPNTRINRAHVQRYRNEVFGKLYSSPRFGIAERFDMLEARVLYLESWAARRPREPLTKPKD